MKIQSSQAAEIEALKAKLAAYEAHGVTCQTFGHVVGACAECNTHEESKEAGLVALKADMAVYVLACSERATEIEALRKDTVKLREMLGLQWCAGQGVYPYTDDGQFFDGSEMPTIDFMSDAPEEIQKKFLARMRNAAAEREKNAATGQSQKRKYVRKKFAAAMQTKEAS